MHQLEHTGLDAVEEEAGNLAVDLDLVAQLVWAIGDGHLEVLPDEREQHRILPLAVTQVRLALDAFADEPRALRVTDRALVEAVARELNRWKPRSSSR